MGAINAPQCLRCQARMEAGFFLDDIDAEIHKAQEWVSGQPKRSWWAGLDLKGNERHAVTTYRCPKCGYLESYAGKD